MRNNSLLAPEILNNRTLYRSQVIPVNSSRSVINALSNIYEDSFNSPEQEIASREQSRPRINRELKNLYENINYDTEQSTGRNVRKTTLSRLSPQEVTSSRNRKLAG